MESKSLTEVLDSKPLPEAPATDEMLDEAAPPAEPEKLTKKQIGQLRRQYVTTVHGTVKACNHKAKFSKDKQPGNNCVHCWQAFFMTSVDLDFIHAVLTQKGGKALVALKGTKFVRMFHGFLSQKMLPMLAAEINKENEAMANDATAQIVGGTFGSQTH